MVLAVSKAFVEQCLKHTCLVQLELASLKKRASEVTAENTGNVERQSAHFASKTVFRLHTVQ